MAEKEERILIARSTDYTLTDTDKGKLFEGNIEPHCANVFTRQEAIEKMAKAICKFEMMTSRHICKDCDEECFEHLELEVVDTAEAALNALLGEPND